MDHPVSSDQEKTKICPACGIRKPLSDFLITPLDHIKQYSDFCNTCRNRGVRPWEKKLSKKQTGSGDEDEGGGGGKTRQNTVNYFARLLARQLQELHTVQTEFEKQEYRDKIGEEDKEGLTKVSETSTEKGRAQQKEKATKAASIEKTAKGVGEKASLSSSADFLSPVQIKKGFFVPHQTGALAAWAEMFRWFINYSYLMHNPAIMMYNFSLQFSLLTRFNPTLKNASSPGADNSSTSNKPFLYNMGEKGGLFSQPQKTATESASQANPEKSPQLKLPTGK